MSNTPELDINLLSGLKEILTNANIDYKVNNKPDMSDSEYDKCKKSYLELYENVYGTLPETPVSLMGIANRFWSHRRLFVQYVNRPLVVSGPQQDGHVVGLRIGASDFSAPITWGI